MKQKDYYQILGLSRDASADQIKKAFKVLAKKYHPDRNPGNAEAEEKFKAGNEAHDVLSNEKKRALYDKVGKDWQFYYDNGTNPDDHLRPPASGGYGYSGDPSDLMGGSISDILEGLFGGFGTGSEGRGSGPAKGADYEGQIEITLEEAFKGTTRVLDLGYGKIRIRLKPGIEDGKTLKIKGKGGPGSSGGPPGNLLLRVTVLSHPAFKRKGKDLYTEITADLYTCLLGGKIRIHALDNELELQIPELTSPGSLLRMRGKGMPAYGAKEKTGDLLVKVKVKIPSRLSPREKELLGELQAIHSS